MNRQTDVNMRLSPMHTGLAMQEFINEFAAYTDGAPITGASGGYAVGLLKSEYSKNDIVKIFNPVTEKSPSSKLPLLTNVRVNIVSPFSAFLGLRPVVRAFRTNLGGR